MTRDTDGDGKIDQWFLANAVNELVSEGFLYKMERKGTFVSQLHKTVNRTG